MGVLQDKTMLFIIGAPRSGTTWLHHILGAHPDVAALQVELRHFNQYIQPQRKAYQTEKENIANGTRNLGHPNIMDEAEFNQHLQAFTEDVYQRIAATNENATHIVDKHPGYALAIADIQALIPEAKFIHVLRDGRDVVRSMISAHQREGFGHGNLWGAAHHWKENVEAAHTFHSQHPGTCYELRYEDLEARPEATLKALLEFCKLDHSDAILQHLTGPNGPIHQKVSAPHQTKNEASRNSVILSLKERFLLNEIAGKLLLQLNYTDNRHWWANSATDRTKMHFYQFARGMKNMFGKSSTAK